MQLVPQLFPCPPALFRGSVTITPPPTAVPGLFKAQFNARLATLVAPPSNGSAPSDPLEAKLAAQIAARLKKGESLSDIVAALSQSLATSVANAGGRADTQALRKLQTVFAAALSPPGKAPPSADDVGALALAHRFRQLAEIAANAAPAEPTGQPNRFLGPDLDAKAKVDLAPAEIKQPSKAETPGSFAVSSDSIVLAATIALGASPPAISVKPTGTAPTENGTRPAASATAATTLDPHLPAAPATSVTTPDADARAVTAQAQTQAAAVAQPTASLESTLAAPVAALFATDGRTVASSERKIGTNGDTPLGRSLTRAFNLASSTEPAIAATASDAKTGAHTGDDLARFLDTFAAALAKADGSANASLTPTSPAHDFLATLDAANAASVATSQAGPTPLLGIANPNGAPAPVAFDAALFATPPTYTPQNADRYAVVEQVLKGLSIRNLGGISNAEVRIRLAPEHLGEVNVKLVINSGQVSATVVAANADVRDTLVANQQHLARSLESAGLKLSSFNVDVSNGGFAGFQHQQQQQPSATRGSVAEAFDDSFVPDDLAIAATPSFAPPQASVALGHLNALV